MATGTLFSSTQILYRTEKKHLLGFSHKNTSVFLWKKRLIVSGRRQRRWLAEEAHPISAAAAADAIVSVSSICVSFSFVFFPTQYCQIATKMRQVKEKARSQKRRQPEKGQFSLPSGLSETLQLLSTAQRLATLFPPVSFFSSKEQEMPPQSKHHVIEIVRRKGRGRGPQMEGGGGQRATPADTTTGCSRRGGKRP